MKNPNTKFLFLMLLAIGMLLAAALTIFHVFFAEWRWSNEIVHSAIEGMGSVIALLMAFLMFRPSESSAWNKTGVALGFLVLGIADALHAFTPPGQSFVFLRSVGVLAGAMGFVLAWTNACNESPQCKRWAGVGVIVLMAILGVWALGFEQTLPQMVQNGSFTPLATGMNVFGGLLFLAAAWRFVMLYRQTGETEAIGFVFIAILFGLSAISFTESEIWDAVWWFWHLLRFFSYLLALGLFIRTYRQIEAEKDEQREKLEEINVELRASRAVSNRISRELETIIDALPGLIFYKDTHNNLIRVNKYFADAHHTGKQNLVGRNCFDLYPEAEAQSYWNDDQEVISTRQPKINIVEPWDTEEGHKWVLTSKIPYVENDEVLGLIGISLDITTQKQQEEELRRIAAELNRSNAELEQFAYIASHDLRAPLRAIVSLSGWLEQDLGGSLPPESAEHLRLLRGRTQRMEALLDSILEYSRSNRIAAEISEIDPGAIIGEIADSLGLADRFILELGDLPCFTTARMPFQQVLRNLIDNAVKHHDQAKGTIAIIAARRDGMIEFSVKDDGPGIPERFHEKVFQMFQTLKPRDEVEGSGMGLALVKKIVEHYGGFVALHPVQPRGTEVRFTWPFEIEKEKDFHGKEKR